MSENSLKKHSKGNQAEDTGQNRVFPTASVGPQCNSWRWACSWQQINAAQLECRLHPELTHEMQFFFVTRNRVHKYMLCSLYLLPRLPQELRKALQREEFWGKKIYPPDTNCQLPSH